MKQQKPRTIAIFDKVVEGMAIAVIGELVVGGREFLEALRSDAGEIPGELREFSEGHRSTSHEAVDQRLLAHRHKPNPRREKSVQEER